MDPIYLNLLSLVLLIMCAYAWTAQLTRALIACSAAFLVAAVWTTLATIYPWSPGIAVALMVVTLMGSMTAVALYVTDVVWAPFCLEMTYMLILCWILCPLLVAANFAALALL